MKKTLAIGMISVVAIALILWIAYPADRGATGNVLNVFDNTQKAIVSEPLKIGVLTYPGALPFFVAQEKGFFKEEGVDVDIVAINDPTQMISALAGDRIQFLYSTADFTPVIKASGVDIKEIFAVDIGYGSDGLLVKNDTLSIKDLKGKTVYLSTGTPSHFLLRYVADSAGMKPEDIKLVQMEADQVGAAFFAGKIDYGMTCEPWLSKASGRPDGKILFTSKDNAGIITETLVVRDAVLQSRKEDSKAILRALIRATEFSRTNRKEAISIASKKMGLPENELEAQLETVKFLDYAENLKKFDRHTALNIFELTEKAISIYKEDGIIQSDVNAGELIDSTLLDKLYK